MSKSKIKSELFMAKNSTSLPNSSTIIYHKGAENVVENQVFEVNTKDGAYHFRRDSLVESLKALEKYSTTHTKKLPTEDASLYHKTVEAIKLLYSFPSLYELVVSDIRDVFGSPDKVIPGSVAAFFTGCFLDDKFPGQSSCSPKCVSSLQPSENTPGYSECEDLVLIYADGEFSSLNDKKSQHCFVYISDTNDSFSGFSQENISQLKSVDILTVTLIFGDQDGNYTEVTSPIHCDLLPLAEKIGATESNSSSDNTAWTVVLIIILVILLVVLFYFLFKFYKIWSF